MKYLIQCPFCNTTYIVGNVNDEFCCEKCGAANGPADIVERVDDSPKTYVHNTYNINQAPKKVRSGVGLSILITGIVLIAIIGIIVFAVNVYSPVRYTSVSSTSSGEAKAVSQPVAAILDAAKSDDASLVLEYVYRPENSLVTDDQINQIVTRDYLDPIFAMDDTRVTEIYYAFAEELYGLNVLYYQVHFSNDSIVYMNFCKGCRGIQDFFIR